MDPPERAPSAEVDGFLRRAASGSSMRRDKGLPPFTRPRLRRRGSHGLRRDLSSAFARAPGRCSASVGDGRLELTQQLFTRATTRIAGGRESRSGTNSARPGTPADHHPETAARLARPPRRWRPQAAGRRASRPIGAGCYLIVFTAGRRRSSVPGFAALTGSTRAAEGQPPGSLEVGDRGRALGLMVNYMKRQKCCQDVEIPQPAGVAGELSGPLLHSASRDSDVFEDRSGCSGAQTPPLAVELSLLASALVARDIALLQAGPERVERLSLGAASQIHARLRRRAGKAARSLCAPAAAGPNPGVEHLPLGPILTLTILTVEFAVCRGGWPEQRERIEFR